MYFIDNSLNRNFINIKIKPDANTGQAIHQIKEVFSGLNPSSPFDFTFVDEEFAEKFADEERIGKLSLLFSVFAIFISLLGLFGLASFIAERRTREISVRKVLGATVLDIWSLLSGEFILLVLLSIVIAIPIAWFYMRSWMHDYVFRAEIHWWLFALVGSGVILITLMIISVHTIKAALANPAKNLRSE
jgi:ABC-type antimicrobial peptide transport system permease subunit